MQTRNSSHPIASREEWRAQRLKLLDAEKALTRQSDALARQRQALPWVKVEKEYRFRTDEGDATLNDLFRGRSQLLVYHLMFGPDYSAACPSCSMIADGFDGFWPHLAHHDVMLWAVSRAPLEKIQAYKKRMNWSFPWASSNENDFNFDYFVGFSDEQQDKGYNYNFEDRPAIPAGSAGAPAGHAAMCGVDLRTYLKELPGMSAFVREGDEVYHTYSAYARGLDSLWGAYQWLDRAPAGRNEPDGPWWKRRDEYGPI